MIDVSPPVHILVVDDNPDAVALLQLVMAKDGHRISTATSGEQAWALLESSLQSDDPVRLMLLDLLMPEMDGIEILRRVRQHPRLSHVPVIVVTAAYSPAQEIAGLEAGADDFIAKPYNGQQLRARVRAVLRTRYAEEALSRAEALSHMLIEGIHDLVFAIDAQGHFSYVTPSVEQLVGYTPAELTSGQVTLEWLVHPADYERARQLLQRALNEQTACETELRVIHRDGEPLWAAMSVAPRRDGAGLQGILRDRTARHKVEEALRSRNEELAALNLLAQRINESLDPQSMLAETMDMLMDVLDAEFGIVYTLEGERLCVQAGHGLPASTVENAGLAEATRDLRLDEIRVYRRDTPGEPDPPQALRDVEAQSWVSLPLRVRGKPVGLLVLASRDTACFDAAEVDFLAAAGEQIALGLRNAQLFAETQRRAGELELIHHATHAVSSTLNLETVLETIMAQAVEVFQVQAGSVMLLEGQEELIFAAAAGPSNDRLRGTRVPVASSFAGQVVRQGQPLMISNAQTDERLYRSVDGITGLTTQNLLAAPLRVRDQTIGVLEVINKRSGDFSQADLALLEALAGPAATAIHNAQLFEAALRHTEEIQRSQAQLIRSEKLAATGRLAVSLAHEINNPLQAMQNLLHLALEYEITDEKRREFLEVAREETSRLIALVQQTLEFYRPAQSHTGQMDVNATIERVLALSRKKLQHSGVEVELKLARELPPVKAVPDQIAQVFLNLVVNAAEAMSDGGRLCIESSICEGQVQVTLADTGPGITPEDLAHIFEPFYTTKDYGTGLGLAVSYNIIESHGGTIGVESMAGHGATFTVRLPAQTPEPQPARPRKRKTKRETGRAKSET